MSRETDVDVAGVRVRANHLAELVTRLCRVGEPFVAYKVQRVLGARTSHIAFGPFEREAIVRAVADRPPQFSELYTVLLGELQHRRAEGLSSRSAPGSRLGDTTPSGRPRPRRSLPQAADGDGFLQRLEAYALRPRTPNRPNVTVTKDTLLEIFRQGLERTKSKPPQPSYQQIADDNDVKRTWVTAIVKWAENYPRLAHDAIWRQEVPAWFSTIVRD